MRQPRFAGFFPFIETVGEDETATVHGCVAKSWLVEGGLGAGIAESHAFFTWRAWWQIETELHRFERRFRALGDDRHEAGQGDVIAGRPVDDQRAGEFARE